MLHQDQLSNDKVIVDCPPAKWNIANTVPRQLALQWALKGKLQPHFKLNPDDVWDCCLKGLMHANFSMILNHPQLARAHGPASQGIIPDLTFATVASGIQRNISYLHHHQLFCFETAVRFMVQHDMCIRKKWFDYVVSPCRMHTRHYYYTLAVEIAREQNKHIVFVS